MSFLPICIDIAGKKILLVGGGRVAAQKLRTLCLYDAEVVVCAPDVSEEVRRYPVTVLERRYGPDLLEGVFLVYACTDDRALNGRIGGDARARGILANVADDPSRCDFVSPAVWKQGVMSVAVSSNGEDARRSAAWRDRVAEVFRDAHACE